MTKDCCRYKITYKAAKTILWKWGHNFSTFWKCFSYRQCQIFGNGYGQGSPRYHVMAVCNLGTLCSAISIPPGLSSNQASRGEEALINNYNTNIFIYIYIFNHMNYIPYVGYVQFTTEALEHSNICGSDISNIYYKNKMHFMQWHSTLIIIVLIGQLATSREGIYQWDIITKHFKAHSLKTLPRNSAVNCTIHLLDKDKTAVFTEFYL